MKSEGCAADGVVHFLAPIIGTLLKPIDRRESIYAAIYYKWLKDFMEAGKARLMGDSLREARRDEVTGLKRENERLKSVVGELTLENYLLKKSVTE